MQNYELKQQLNWIKNKFTLKVKTYEQENNEVKLIKEQYSTESKKKIIHDLFELKDKKGIDMTVVRVGKEPNKVEFNKIYFRADGKMAWLYILKNPLNGAAVVKKEGGDNE